ncbi:lipopolysaccharide biosynthesis protein [Porcipelethomonas sp.]|uniref:lipopolysaccharide biosynthesis protein n=1 Tax=Porcipelethomonas sp. TaxID=2981675 RepID=UPI003EF96CBD
MNKYKKLIGNTLIFAVGQTGAKIFSFLLVRLYTAVLMPDEYSTAELLYNTLNVLYPIITFSMADAIVRFGLDKTYDNRKVYSSANFMLFIGIIFLACTLPIWNASELYHGYTGLLFVYCLCSCFRQLTAQYARAAGHVKLFALDGIFAVLTQFLCNVLFMVYFDLGIKGYILSFIASDIFSIIFLYITGKIYKSFRIRFIDKALIKEMLKYSLPLVPTYLLWWITSSSDRMFVIKMVSNEANGIYAAAYKLPTLLMFLTTMFYQAWQMSSVEEKDSNELGLFYKNVYETYSSLIFIAAGFLITFSKPVTDLLLSDEKYSGAEHYTVILIVSMVFQCFCQFLSSIYSVKKKSQNSCFTALAAALTNVILNIVLIPKFGVYGAAIATALSYFICYLIRIIDTRRFVYFKLNVLQTVLNTVLLTVMCIISIKETEYYIIELTFLFIILVLVNFSKTIKLISKLMNTEKIHSKIMIKILNKIS